METSSNPNYDPGFLNSPGKGQSAANPLAPVYIESLGVVSDLSVYQNIYGRTINASTGFTIGESGAFTEGGFFVQPPGVFESDVVFKSDVFIGPPQIYVGGVRYVPTTIVGKNGTFVVLAQG